MNNNHKSIDTFKQIKCNITIDQNMFIYYQQKVSISINRFHFTKRFINLIFCHSYHLL